MAGDPDQAAGADVSLGQAQRGDGGMVGDKSLLIRMDRQAQRSRQFSRVTSWICRLAIDISIEGGGDLGFRLWPVVSGCGYSEELHEQVLAEVRSRVAGIDSDSVCGLWIPFFVRGRLLAPIHKDDLADCPMTGLPEPSYRFSQNPEPGGRLHITGRYPAGERLRGGCADPRVAAWRLGIAGRCFVAGGRGLATRAHDAKDT